ncbi:hypothetical protein UK82_12680 [Frankia sp. ACN1ag]|nr:hypothetical protein UK82_12680 [Frankia sp. ACN1ag]
MYGRPPAGSRNRVFLEENGWNDFGFSTFWNISLADSDGVIHRLGHVRIGAFNLGNQRRVTIPSSFIRLPEQFFSLGADDAYYSALTELGDDVRDTVLRGLRDIALDLDTFERARSEKVTQDSLLRSITQSTVQGQLHRMATGGVRLSPYEFTFHHYFRGSKGRIRSTVALNFQVEPESKPASNVHVIIGRNGVGKSVLLNSMANTLVRPGGQDAGSIDFVEPADRMLASKFSRVVSVSFSAFDEFEPLRGSEKSDTAMLAYDYIGLKLVGPSKSGSLKTSTTLANEFAASVKKCLDRPRLARWRRALEMLQSDPIFAEFEVARLAESTEDEEIQAAAKKIFRGLSSGHKIVLLSITRLVEAVEEATLVLLDEPEAHLHPPLLAAFIRALSDLLENRNGVAIIATHSPVVLQEVPRSCVWKLRRSGWEVSVDRPEIETFGENVGILTQEVFGLEVTTSGFHRTLMEAAGSDLSYEALLGQFGNQLGGEARALLRVLILSRRDR